MEKDKAEGGGLKRRPGKGHPFGGEARKKEKGGDHEGKETTVRTPEEKKPRRRCVCPRVPPRVRLVCCRILDNRIVEVALMLLTFYALFGDDVRLLATPRSADPIFDAFTSIALIAFGLEIILSCIGKKDYLFHLFFYLDVVSLLSLVLDLSSVDEAMYVWAEEGNSDAEGEVSQATLAGKAGSKVARMLRLIRLVRLIRVAKLYKNIGFSSAPRADEELREFDSFLEPEESIGMDDDLKEETEPSKRGETSENAAGEEFQSEVGKKLTEKTTRKIVFVVLALTLILPVLSEENLVTKFASEKSGLELVAEYATAAQRGENQDSWLRVYTHATLFYMNYHRKGGIGDLGGNPSHLAFFQLALPLYQTTMLDGRIYQDIPCMGFSSCSNSLVLPQEAAARLYLPEAVANGTLIVDDLGSIDELRLSEREVYTAYFCNATSADGAVGGTQKATDCDLDRVTQIRAVFDRRAGSRLQAGLSVTRTFIVCFILILGALLINRDENNLVLIPIERMMVKMNEIQNNPLAAANMSDDAALDSGKKAHAVHGKPLDDDDYSSPFRAVQALFSGKSKASSDSMETAMLEKTIIKIGGLLALGFGEAGAEIIAKNMKNADGGLNAMLDGKKLQAIFGFCDIRNFTDATEILKEKVMVFVNQIAEIVHGTVDQYSGCANKNIGDAFLLVWKFPEVEREGGVKEQLMDTATTNRLADMALVSFVKVIAGINKSQVLAEYRDIPELVQRLGTGWKVKMGFGLHVGWAIEGAIGSEFKIDASYLSPNVNMASRLEAATKQYGVYILISNELYDIMSPQAQLNCRQIDRATVKGSQVPLGLYTVDLDPGRLSVVGHPLAGASGALQNKSRLRQQRNLQKQKLWSSRTSISAMFETDPDIVTMREHLTKEFITTFRKGFSHYQAGEWHRAREIFVKTQFMLGVEDVPSTVLLTFMAGYDFVAPSDWMGFRELVEK
ncbi:putative adenylyl cyclase [Neospora caninum Liverpool]|uniref:Adenylyl cyclase, putative n=1 Tax=Neospora caninum (strain Liverpool) TaxID=572307 RepID=F0VBU4_NEOCL|nr:putative adenylyl cyclase [Neospora caninum Liverpool]CBZ51078.1 putative adenylyl cyclase [Neospora caninum Liverpool]CEL68385.1 TPA: adenylyl cyclase, putative [Neospora caninum Liverpool]|eukprot:XP_003881111.1 putative adenylyl cyclase [Neospora caninum Liverpool]